MTITIYHNPDCGTSRNTLAMIRASGEEPTVIEYLKDPPNRERLKGLIAAMGISMRGLLREKGTPYTDLDLGNPKWSDDDLLDFMMAHPILINRPIVVTPKGVRLCRPSEAVLEILPNRAIGRFVKEDGEVVGARGMSRHLVVSALGVAQILAWGCSYYLPAVLAKPIATDTGWSLTWVVGGLSAGLLISGIVSSVTGGLIQRTGGRPVLMAGAVLLASGLTVMGLAPNLPVYFLAWVLMGIGMSASLYDAGFATLGRLYGKDARSAITSLTLFGGFASTVCWPLSAFLVEHVGWRGACFTYAGIQLALSLPMFLLFVPHAQPATKLVNPGDTSTRGLQVPRSTFALLAGITSLAAMIASMISVHLLTVLQLRDIDLTVAVGLGTLIGPSQVGARVIEMLVGRHHHPLWAMVASVTLLALGTGLLLSGWPVTALALVLYGAGNGIHTIARGALPLVLFDPRHYASIMGRLATPSLIMQAVAPSVGALLLEHGGSSLMLGVLFAAALTAVLLVLFLIRFSLTRRRPAVSS